MYKINEIFLSVQGEGFYLGRPSVFVRFSGCNTECEFCDTPHQSGMEMELSKVLQAILDCCQIRHVTTKSLACVFTGGEPLLQLDLPLVNAVKNMDMDLHIETNGSLDAERKAIEKESSLRGMLSLFEEVTVSPKINPVSSLVFEFATTFKVIIPFPLAFTEGSLESAKAKGGSIKTFIAQPQTPSSGLNGWEWRNNVNEALSFSLKRKQLYGETWRVIPQTHIIMRVR
jgi:organic radical activating enzyme